MLVQLVCLDRRYQRMNCYNIREIQTLLKSQYAPNSNDTANVNFLMADTILGLRYRLMNLTVIDSSMLNYYRNTLYCNYRSNTLLTSTLTAVQHLNINTMCKELNT